MHQHTNPAQIHDSRTTAGGVNDFAPTAANFVAQTPLSFIERTAAIYADYPSVVHGARRYTWGQTYARCCQCADALRRAGIGSGDTVSVMLHNTPEMVEAHFAVPMAGAVLHAINTRLDPASIAYMLNHAQAKIIFVDREFAPIMAQAMILAQCTVPVVNIDDALYTGEHAMIGSTEYEAFLRTGDAHAAWQMPDNEWDAVCVNYTSGTTGEPKGVVYHHRGAYLNALSNILEWDMRKHPVYLWVLPMFHCNGWCFPWTIAARAGVNICLRGVHIPTIYERMSSEGVTHFCGAPIVHQMLLTASPELKSTLKHPIQAMIAGAPPPAAIIQGMADLGIDLTHVYGLTEVYGPATVCVKHESWAEKDITEQAQLNARQGMRYHLQQRVDVLDPHTLRPVPHDGQTIGEIMFQGNTVMKGYLKNPEATQQALAGGWFHSGDLAVIQPDGYIKIKDRSKDIIISGGENISSVEIEEVLYRHPNIMAAAVVAQPHEQWGEVPCAFVELKPGIEMQAQELITHCKNHLAGFKVPRAIVFGELPKTSTGKIQKFELRQRCQSNRAIDA